MKGHLSWVYIVSTFATHLTYAQISPNIMYTFIFSKLCEGLFVDGFGT